MPHSTAYLMILGAVASVLLATAKAASWKAPRWRFLRSIGWNVAEVISAGMRESFARPLVVLALLALAGLGFGLSVPLGYSARWCGPRHRVCAPTPSTTTTTNYVPTTTNSATTTTATTTSATTTSATTTSATTTTASTTTVSTPSGSVAWRGDYETGDFSQWWLRQWSCAGGDNSVSSVGNTCASIVSSPVAQGKYATEFQDFPHGTSTAPNDRSETLATQAESGGYPGQEWYYGWYTDFPGPSQQFWPNGDDWNDFVQFFSTDGNAWMYFGIAANNGTPKIYSDGPYGHIILANPLAYDHWYHFVVHAVWSTDPSVGVFEVWLDGQKLISFQGATLKAATVPENSSYTVPGVVIAQGFYRGSSSFTNTVIQDGFCRATSYDAAANC
jgi:hypothetical protein